MKRLRMWRCNVVCLWSWMAAHEWSYIPLIVQFCSRFAWAAWDVGWRWGFRGLGQEKLAFWCPGRHLRLLLGQQLILFNVWDCHHAVIAQSLCLLPVLAHHQHGLMNFEKNSLLTNCTLSASYSALIQISSASFHFCLGWDPHTSPSLWSNCNRESDSSSSLVEICYPGWRVHTGWWGCNALLISYLMICLLTSLSCLLHHQALLCFVFLLYFSQVPMLMLTIWSAPRSPSPSGWSWWPSSPGYTAAQHLKPQNWASSARLPQTTAPPNF